MRLALILIAAMTIFGVTACDYAGETRAGGTVSGTASGMQSLDSSMGVRLQIATGWRVREEGPRSLWLVSGDGASELILTRQSTDAGDYATRMATESDLLRSQQIDVSGPIETKMFGKPAAAVSSSGPEYSRIVIASDDWVISAQRQGPFDRNWARAVSGMLAADGRGPAIPSLQ